MPMDLTGKSLTSVTDAVSASTERLVYRFKIPPKLAPYADGLVEIGLVALEISEERRAASRLPPDDKLGLAYETLKESLRELGFAAKDADGKPSVRRVQVNTGDGSADRALAQMHAKVRGLVANGYNKVHNNDKEDVESFLSTFEVATLP